MNKKKILIALICFVSTTCLYAQVKSDSVKSAREIIIENEKNRKDQPDITNNKNVITRYNENSPKTKKCMLKKNKKELPAAKDAVKDRNTKDPQIDKMIQPVMKTDSTISKKNND